MNTTVRIKQSEVYKDWHIVDAAGRPLGRVATEVATLLKGKHKPTYERHLDDGDFVIVINASQVRVSGAKDQQIKYYRHSGYPGGLKSRTYAQMMDKFPERVLEQAIWGMLPKGPLGKQMFRHLKVYKHANHPHKSQIASTETAQAARKAAQAELATTERKVARLRPLSVPQVTESGAEPKAKRTVTPASAAARAAKSRVRGTQPAAPAEVEETPIPVAEAPVVEAPVAEAPAAEAPKRTPRNKAAGAEASAPATTEEAEKPKRAPRRKAAEATTEASTEEKPKPARRSAAAKSEGTEE